MNEEEKYAELWQAAADNRLSAEDESRMLSAALSQIRHKEAAEKARRSPLPWIMAAACVGFALCLTMSIVGWTRYSRLDADVQNMAISAENGQKSKVTLPDGTVVNINSGSELLYQSTFNRKNREITLVGEAFFDVAHNPDLPFIVRAQDVSVRAIGTKFNVCAYPEDESVVTTLVEGKVLASAGGESCTMVPGDEAVWNRNESRFKLSKTQRGSHQVPWMDNQIFLDDESFAQLAKMITRMYNVEIDYSDCDVADLRFTGLLRNSSLSSLLDLVCATSDLKYTMQNDVIHFYKGGR